MVVKPLNIVFMGTPDFSVPTLEALIAAGHHVGAVYTQPPRPAGRGQKERPSPVHMAAERHGIAVRTPRNLKDAADQTAFAALGADAAVVVAYGLLLPKAVLEAPRLGCFNLHASKLPRWRGAAPIQRAILAGDTETAVAVMRMEIGLDTGPIVRETVLGIGGRETAPALHDRLAAAGAPLMVAALDDLAEGRASERIQPEDGITYARKIEKDEGRIDWSQPADDLDRLVRALGAAPGVSFALGSERIKLLEAEPVAGRGAPGTAIDDALTIACGAGALRLLRLQRPGKGPLPAADFLRGFPVPAGTKLG